MNNKQIIRTLKNTVSTIIGSVFMFLNMLMKLLLVGLIIGCIIGLIGYIKFKPIIDSARQTAYDKISNMNESDFIKPMDTYIYDKDGEEIGLINSGRYKYVPIEDISMYIQNGYISQEDKRFKEHSGVDFISTGRAFVSLIKNKGKIKQGGSTITQQVIKNTYLTQEKSFQRKLAEFIIAPQLEMKFNKSKIMEFYCNSNFYGNRCYGVEAASQYYFGKRAKDVSVAEACLLVGLSNSPSAYDPVIHPDKALKKRNRVINTFYENGYIDENTKNNAINEPLNIVQKQDKSTFETYQSSYAIHCAAIELMRLDNFNFKYIFNTKDEYDKYVNKYDTVYNEKTNLIRSGGYKIYTSFDKNIQNVLQENIDKSLNEFTEVSENGKYAMQGAGVVADNQTGYVVAIVGGRGTNDAFNRAFLSARQPGSAIKPLIDYTPAFDTGNYYPSKIMDDKEIENGPKNSGGGYRGKITIREAVNRSINTIAWQVLQEIGVNNGLNYLSEMEFQKISYIDNNLPALSIGGFTKGVRIVDLCKGYQTLANDGIYTNKTCIIDIKDKNNESVLKNYKDITKQVYDKDSAFMMTDVLKGTINEKFGTGYGLALLNGMPVAGKTGTTNDNKDTWFSGYSKYYTTTVWVGYDIPREMPGIYGKTYSGKIWQNIMNEINKDLPILDWKPSDTIYHSSFNHETGDAVSVENGTSDIFSRSADIRKQEMLKQKETEDFLNNIYEQVEKYQLSSIGSVEDIYKIDDNYANIRNIVLNVSDEQKKNELLDKCFNKYTEFLNIKESMKDEIQAYEKQKKLDEQKALIEQQKQNEQKRLKFIKDTRLKEADNSIKELLSLKYQSDYTDLINKAKDKVLLLSEYDEYSSYVQKLKNAVNFVNTLPTYDEYIAIENLKKQKELEEQRIKESEQNALNDKLNKITVIETSPVNINNETIPYGPGAY